MSDYKPYRVLRKIVTVVDDGDDTLACYPHGKVGARMIATGKIGIIFREGVINAPTEEEIALFNLPALSGLVKPIPQDPRGFDARLSGVARSIKGSQRGREAGIIETFERTSAKAKPEPTPEVIVEAEPEPEPEAKQFTKPESKPESKSKSRFNTKPETMEPIRDKTKEGDLNE